MVIVNLYSENLCMYQPQGKLTSAPTVSDPNGYAALQTQPVPETVNGVQTPLPHSESHTRVVNVRYMLVVSKYTCIMADLYSYNLRINQPQGKPTVLPPNFGKDKQLYSAANAEVKVPVPVTVNPLQTHDAIPSSQSNISNMVS